MLHGVDHFDTGREAIPDNSPHFVTDTVGQRLRDVPLVTRGIVSRVARYLIGGEYIETDAAAYPGNSGGPLVDECSRVVGVVTAGRTDTEGITIAISTNELLRMLEDVARGPEQPPLPSPLFTDPFAFCRWVDTIDWPVDKQPLGRHYVGDPAPFNRPGDAGNEVVWRCWAGKVLGCVVGANAAPCQKANTSREPSPELLTWCRENPGYPPPMAVTGHSNIFEWTCEGRIPRIVRQIIPDSMVDGLGYFLGPWFEIRP